MNARYERTANPTSILSAVQLENEGIKTLGYASILSECLQAHVESAPKEVALFVTHLADKVTNVENDAAIMLHTAIKQVMTPAKSPTSATSTPHINDDTNLADRMDNANSGSNSAGGQSAAIVTSVSIDATMKQLMDSAKLNQTAGPLIPFLRGIISCQTEQFKSNIEELGDKHPINKAIATTDVRQFRVEFEKLFDQTYPREERKRQLLTRINELVFDETKNLLVFRTSLFKLKRLCEEITDHRSFSHHTASIMSDITSKAMELISMTTNAEIRMEVSHRMMGIGSPTLDQMTEALKTADVLLRRRNPTYDQAPIPAHNAIPARDRPDRSPCPACKFTWNIDWYHTVNKCFMHPDRREEKKDWIAKRTTLHVEKTGKKPIMYTNWPVASKKRGGESPQTTVQPKRERGI